MRGPAAHVPHRTTYRVNEARRKVEAALKLAEKKGQRAIANRLRDAIELMIEAVID